MGRLVGFVVLNVAVGVAMAVTHDWYNTTKTKLNQQSK